MRKSSSFLGALAVGALAVGVSVYAAPRVDSTRGADKSSSGRLVTGASDHLQAVVDGSVAAGASYYALVPVPAQGNVTYSAAVNQGATFVLDGGTSETLFFELRMGGWGGNMDVWQATVDWVNGYASGSGAPLERPVVACDPGAPDLGNGTCNAAFGAGSLCTGVAPNSCRDAFQDLGNPDLVSPGISDVNQSSITYGSTPLPPPGSADSGQAGYGGVLVVNVPAGAAGTYSISFVSGASTFMTVGGSDIIIKEFRPGIIDIPTGKCCVISDGSCTDGLSLGACNAVGGLHFAGGVCADGCIECVVDADCDDGDACTSETCSAGGICNRGTIAGFDPATQCCDGSTGAITDLDDGDDCTDDSCDGVGSCSNRAAGSCGADTHGPSAAGTTCDDGNACTFADVCDGANSSAAGGCSGTDANTVACASSADCAVATGSSLDCIGGNCFCTLSPPLTFAITPGDNADPNCFDDGEKVTATVQVGASLDEITGGELAITYTPGCLDLLGVTTVAPFNNILYMDTSVPGEIFIAVGIDLGGTGVSGGNFDLVSFSFNKSGGCAACNLCFTDVNPRHTRLTNSLGQTVTVTPECSKNVRGNGTLSLATPDGGKYNTACDSANRDVAWAAPSAADTCALASFSCGGLYRNPFSGAVVDVSTIGVDPMGGGNFPIGDATFCCSAANDCGDALQQCWTVTVNDETSLDVQLQLSPTMASQPGMGLDRCIRFEMFSNCVQAPLVFDENVTFGGLFDLVGKVNSSIKIPSAGQFACITARDTLHTLRSCYTFGAGDCDADGVLHATFKGDPFFGGNWLVGGNLDGYDGALGVPSTNAIDITDFGVFVSQYPSAGGSGDTPCGTAGPNADINGDGMVDLLDFTFISMNFLEDSKDCCCPGSSAGDGAPSGRRSISVADLRANGMADMAVADLNNDGVVDTADIAALLEGQMPSKKGPTRRGALR